MAAAAGLTGKVQLAANTVALIENWKLSYKMGKEEYSPFGAAVNVAKKRIATILDVSGSFDGKWDMSDTNGQVALQAAALAGTAVTLKLYVNETNYYTGTAILDMDIENSSDGIPTVSFSFEQDGDTAWTQAA